MAMDQIKGWETKGMRRLFRFRRKDQETVDGALNTDIERWQGRYGQTETTFQSPKARVELRDGYDHRPTAVLTYFFLKKKVFAWRRTEWRRIHKL